MFLHTRRHEGPPYFAEQSSVPLDFVPLLTNKMATADEENRVMETDVGVLTLGNNELIIHHKPRKITRSPSARVDFNEFLTPHLGNVNHRTRGCFGFSVRGKNPRCAPIENRYRD